MKQSMQSKQLKQSKKRVVVIGGGNGASIAIRALKEHEDLFDISTIISMSDSGGSSGQLREKLGVLPPGDILRATLALSRHDHASVREIFYERRFSAGSIGEKHNIGNLFLALVEKQTGDVRQGIRALEAALDCIGHAIPATLDATTLVAELSNGDIVRGEANIDVPAYDRSLRIQRVWLEPKGSASPDAIAAIAKADTIVLGPGDLYTSIIAGLLPSGIQEAIGSSHAKLVAVIGGAIHAHGETGPTRMSEWVSELQKYSPRHFDAIVYNTAVSSERQADTFRKNDWALLTNDMETVTGYTLVGQAFSDDDGYISPARLAEAFLKHL
jgi:uncharacterized cofD-like protein